MRNPVVITRLLVSFLGLALIVLGVLFWTGRALSLLPLHMLLGVLLVICLWVLAGLAFHARASQGLAIATLVWGLVVPLFGVAQTNLLLGPQHWVIQVAHLAIGVIAMGLGHRIARQLAPKPASA